jgi:antitoxin (DNA-binding transcriptional repressor) of toxin-antitoxin stability system
MSDDVLVPAPRRAEREVAIRELRNAGKVLAELVAAGAVGRVTSGGRLVGWLVPANEDERRAEELVARGRLTRPLRAGGLSGRRPLPARSDVRPLSETLHELRDAEDR